MKTYIKDDKPLIRSCINCIYFRKISEDNDKTGYCQAKPLMFAYTMKLNLYAIVKTFSLCQDHFFNDEVQFKKDGLKMVDMQSILSEKDADGNK